jgi:SNF2 family DNA or RNA helicase
VEDENASIDMSEFEKQFASVNKLHDVMDNDTFERVADLRERMTDIIELMSVRKGEIKDVESNLADFDEIQKQVELFLSKLRERKRPFDDARRELKNFIRHDQKELDKLQREWARIMAELAALEAMRRKRLEIDHSTDNAPWRVGIDGKKALPHQLEGAHRMVAAGRAILGDKPGLGKTLQAIMAVNMLRAQGKGKKVLVFTLKPVLPDFEREFRKWYPNQFVHVLNQTKRGLKSEILDLMGLMDECIVLTNYEVWRKDRSIIEKLKACRFDTVILDEAHVFKGKDSFTFRGINEIIYAENECNKCGAAIPPISEKEKAAQPWRRTICLKCEARPEKFDSFRSVKNVFPMTGTPILNRPHDLWPMLNLIDVKGFPSEERFLEDYCEKRCAGCNVRNSYNCTCDGPPRMRWVFMHGGPEVLLKKLGMKFTSRNRDSAGVQMPPQEVRHHYFDMDDELYPRYAAFTRDLKQRAKIAFADGRAITQNDVLAWYTRVRQAATWPDGIEIRDIWRDAETGEMCGTGEILWPTKPEDLPGESIIMDEGEKLIYEAVDNGDRVVVVSAFKRGLEEMQKRLLRKGIRAARFDGDTPQKDRQMIVDDFNAKYTKVGEHKFDVILVNYKTGSTGLNLSGAQQIVILDREWNPGKEEQMLDRVRRLDSEFNSIVHILHCEETATELMDGIMNEKKQMLDGFEADVNIAEAMRKFLEG